VLGVVFPQKNKKLPCNESSLKPAGEH